MIKLMRPQGLPPWPGHWRVDMAPSTSPLPGSLRPPENSGIESIGPERAFVVRVCGIPCLKQMVEGDSPEVGQSTFYCVCCGRQGGWENLALNGEIWNPSPHRLQAENKM